MPQDDPFNRDLMDADMQKLVYNVPIATQSQTRYHTCGWMTGQDICSELLHCQEFPDHLRTRHGIVGQDKTMLTCCWVNCFVDMKKEMVTRHVQEKHLELKYSCPNCPEQFTRSYTLNNHIAKKLAAEWHCLHGHIRCENQSIILGDIADIPTIVAL